MLFVATMGGVAAGDAPLAFAGHVWGGKPWGVLQWGVVAVPALHGLWLLGLGALLAAMASTILRRQDMVTSGWRQRARNVAHLGVGLALTLAPLIVYASTVTLPHTFANGTVTDANEMNQNFSAVETAVDDNDARITALETLLNQSCPAGGSATGVDAAGNLVCATWPF